MKPKSRKREASDKKEKQVSCPRCRGAGLIEAISPDLGEVNFTFHGKGYNHCDICSGTGHILKNY